MCSRHTVVRSRIRQTGLHGVTPAKKSIANTYHGRERDAGKRNVRKEGGGKCQPGGRDAALSRLKGPALAYLVKCRGEFVRVYDVRSLALGDRRTAE